MSSNRKKSDQQTTTTRILIVEDQNSMQQLLEDFLQPNGFEVCCCDSAGQACDLLELGATATFGFLENGPDVESGNLLENVKTDFDVVLTDIKMPGMSGIEFCRIVKERLPHLPVIVMTAYGSLETAVDALRAGAFDFITKPVKLELLKACLFRASENSRLRRRIQHLESLAQIGSFGKLIGQSDEMLKLKSQLARIVDSSAAVLLTGESGSGKEVVARELHQQSKRASYSFVAVNCAALPESLLESELFGHVKGAFTDAREDRAGLFLQANHGTLFLDEIGDMPIEIQPKLLRAIEQKTVRPVGGKTERPFDVRLITATHCDLEAAIEEKKFREDLYYRINVLEIPVPALRTRGTDVLLLAKHFLTHFTDQSGQPTPRLDDEVLQKLLTYDWPGNVRELRNVIERAVVMNQETTISLESLPNKIVNHQPSRLIIGEEDNQPLATLDSIQMRYIRYVLERTQGNQTEAAKILGLDRKTLYRKLKEM